MPVKTIYLVGFRGTGFRDPRYQDETLLIRAGHVGFYFEGENGMILGFHPTEEACRAVGDDDAVKEWLKDHQPMAGALHDDTTIFHRAYALAQDGAATTVWQMPIAVPDEVFEAIRQQADAWYNERKAFIYAFPSEEAAADRDNCATFPRQLGISLPEPTGNLREYIPALKMNGEAWIPEGA